MRFVKQNFVTGLVMSLLLSVTTAVQAQIDVSALENGPLEQRHLALLELRKIPPAQRDSRLWAALAREALRAQQAPRRPENRAQREEYFDYQGDLVSMLAESSDPAMIPVLLKFVGTDGEARAALRKFGDLAVPGLVQILDDGNAPSLDKGGASFALAGMLEARGNTSLSDQYRRQILEVAAEQLYQHLTFGNVIDVAILALATERPDLRAELGQLASETAPWIRRGLSDRDQIKQCQRTIQVQLQKHDARP